MKISIIGSTGYGGAELIRILRNHPEVSIESVHSSSQAGNSIHEGYPHMQTVAEYTLEAIDADEIASKADLVFTATPAGISTKLTPELIEKGLKVIDLSGDFRLKDPSAYTEWYKKTPASEQLLNEAVYGLTEWLDDDITNATLISNPGCYPTAVLLGLAPLVKHHVIDPTSIIIDAKSGVTGAGRNPSLMTLFSEINDNLKIYKVNAHQHIPEIEQTLSGWEADTGPVTLSTHLVPMTRGIMATMYANLTEDLNIDQLHELYGESYNDNYFVRVKELGTFPSTKDVYGSNFNDISIAFDERTNRVMVVSVLDNLMKGAAGQAVQNMNKVLGLDEKTGLDFAPIYP